MLAAVLHGAQGNLCRNLRMPGSASTRPPTDGGFAEYLFVGAVQLDLT